MKTYQLALTVVIKNCDPLESGPEFTMEITPAVLKEQRYHNFAISMIFKKKQDS